MKKSFKELVSKTVKELEKDVLGLRDEVLKLTMQSGSNPAKDTNAVMKKRRHLAVTLTAKNQQKQAEAFKSTKQL
jgi:ribosomal protein L29